MRSARTTVGQEIWWLLALVGFLVFVSTVNVSTYLGARGRGRVPVWTIWRDLTSDLPDGKSNAVTAGYLFIVAVFVVGSFAGLWLTLSADDSVSASHTDPPTSLPPP